MKVEISKTETKVVLSMSVALALQLCEAVERDANEYDNWSVANYAQEIREELRKAGELV